MRENWKTENGGTSGKLAGEVRSEQENGGRAATCPERHENPRKARPKTAAIVLAAGHGRRMGTAVAKQFLELNGYPVIYYALRAFEECELVDRVVLVTGAESVGYCREEIVARYAFSKTAAVVAGGAERYDSVYQGLLALRGWFGEEREDGIVLIHDGARPLVNAAIIGRTVQAAVSFGACAAAMPVKDTIKVADPAGFAAATPDRSTLWQMQTPQTFRYGLVLDAYGRMMADPEKKRGVTDDAMVVETMTEYKVKLVEGSYENIKVTTPEDMRIAACLLGAEGGRIQA